MSGRGRREQPSPGLCALPDSPGVFRKKKATNKMLAESSNASRCTGDLGVFVVPGYAYAVALPESCFAGHLWDRCQLLTQGVGFD